MQVPKKINMNPALAVPSYDGIPIAVIYKPMLLRYNVVFSNFSATTTNRCMYSVLLILVIHLYI